MIQKYITALGAVLKDFKIFFNPKHKRGRVHSIIAAGIILALILLLGRNEVVEEEKTITKTQVQVSSVEQLTDGASLSLIGTVRAFTEADITVERPGRVTRVNAELGQQVPAGFVIATIENAAEQAAVLQAQGAYEAALAASAQTGISVQEANTALSSAKNTAVNAYRSAYGTVNGTIFSNVDSFYGNPNATVPGLKIDGRGQTSFLNSERVAFQSILPEWKNRSAVISPNSNLESELQYAKSQTERAITLVDTFIGVFNQSGSVGGYTEAELQANSATFTGLKSSLIATRSSLDAALSGIQNAEDTVSRAQLSASGSGASGADAQVKQALGSLRSAQAALAKTVLRTPIPGTVNSLTIRTGDFVGGQMSVAKVANNNALEVVTFISENEQDLVAIGDTVRINDSFDGTVTQIAPAVDAVTKKIEVRIALENPDIKNGDTVRITTESRTEVVNETTTLFVPLTAVKFEAKDGYMMRVQNGVLEQFPVTLGTVRGSSVEVTAGLDKTAQFVLDVRGLVSGTEVEVAENK